MRFRISSTAYLSVFVVLANRQLCQGFSALTHRRRNGCSLTQNTGARSQTRLHASDDHFLKKVDGFVDADIVLKESSANDSGSRKRFESKNINGGGAIGSDDEFPVNFILTDKWFYLSPKQRVCDTPDIPAQVAYQCINKRGAIAHGRGTEMDFDILTMRENEAQGEKVNSAQVKSLKDITEIKRELDELSKEKIKHKSVEDVFDEFGGYKEFESITDIKRELTTKGPVVSTSFLLTETFMGSYENANRFDHALIGKFHPVAIIGWEHTDFGEVWLIQPLIRGRFSDVQKIAFRQYGIDDKVIAPTNTFESTTWQNGPHFDIDLSDTPFPEWCTTWPGLETSITTEELETLGEVIGGDLIEAATKRTKFVIRDKTKIARSRECYLTKLEWQKGEKAWRMEVSYLY